MRWITSAPTSPYEIQQKGKNESKAVLSLQLPTQPDNTEGYHDCEHQELLGVLGTSYLHSLGVIIRGDGQGSFRSKFRTEVKTTKYLDRSNPFHPEASGAAWSSFTLHKV